jgi:DNA polymerase
LYGDSLGVLFSSLLRNMILPSLGHELFAADFSKIEVAVLWWLAENIAGLKILQEGKNPYKYQAAANSGKLYEDIADDGDDYQLAKAQILGCGFGMGWEKFQATAFDMYRLLLSEEESRTAVRNYRELHAGVPRLWKSYEEAAISVVRNGQGSLTYAGKCRFILHKKFLWVELPSGRKLAYREPHIVMRETDYGPRETLQFWAVNSKTKKWGVERTWGGTLTENIVQATARDLLMQGMVRLEKRGYRALFSVHDEAVCEAPVGVGSLETFIKTLCKVPAWAQGCPIEAKGWIGPRYRK